jgi:mannose-6-phosphate isomerase-like protein (cupin superfamily)
MQESKEVEHKGFSSAETRSFSHGKLEVMEIAGGSVGRLTLEPGFKWSNDLKETAKTEWCEAPHFQYLVSGRLHVKMQDGSEFEIMPGDVSYLPAGHDAWVIGSEPAVLVDWHGATNYAKPQ